MSDTPTWTPLGAHPPTALTDARIQLHWAAQVLGATADALLPKTQDDSHTNLFWNDAHQALLGRPLADGRRLGLHPGGFALLVVEGDRELARWPLAGQTLAAALEWAQTTLASPLPLSVRDYDMPAHPVADGAAFGSADERFAEVGRHYASADAVLTAVLGEDERSSGVATWPHHFDTGALVFLETGVSAHEAKQILVGMSPGDHTIDEPYYYVIPWPIADGAHLTDIEGGGHWQSQGFVGAALRASRWVETAAAEQRAQVESFLGSALRGGERLVREAT